MRIVSYPGDSDFNVVKLLEMSSKVPTPLAGIIEHVFSSSFVSVYVFKLHAQIKM